MYSRCQYLPNQSKVLEKHVESGDHKCPAGMSATDKLALILSKPGGALANGSRPDRLNRPAVANVTEMSEETLATVAAQCRGKFNRKGRAKPKEKTELMKKVMKELWCERPVLAPQAAHARMAAMIDPRTMLSCSAIQSVVRSARSQSLIWNDRMRGQAAQCAARSLVSAMAGCRR